MIELNHKRIVVTYLMHLGDVVLTTPFLYALRKAAPDSHITYVVDKKLAELVRYNSCIDEVIEVDKKGKDNSLSRLTAIAKEIRSRGVDVVINLHPSERTSYLVWRIGAEVTVGASFWLFRPFLTQYTPLKKWELHAADMYADVLHQIGVVDVSHRGLMIESCPIWDQKVADFYTNHGITPDDCVIGLNVGSAVPAKRWLPERFGQVADACIERGYRVVFFGGPMDTELVQAATVGMKHTPIIATGEFSLGELAKALSRVNVFVSADSGPMHMAASQHVPIVALFGPSNARFYGPYTERKIVLETTQHRTLGKSMNRIIRQGKYVPMEAISVESVLDSIEQLVRE